MNHETSVVLDALLRSQLVLEAKFAAIEEKLDTLQYSLDQLGSVPHSVSTTLRGLEFGITNIDNQLFVLSRKLNED